MFLIHDIKLASLKRLKEKLFVKEDLTNSEYEITRILYFIRLKRTKIFLHRDLNYIRTFTILANNVRKFSQPDKKYSLSGRPFTIFLEELTAGRGPMKAPINRERAWHAKNGDCGPFSLDRQFHFFSITYGVTA